MIKNIGKVLLSVYLLSGLVYGDYDLVAAKKTIDLKVPAKTVYLEFAMATDRVPFYANPLIKHFKENNIKVVLKKEDADAVYILRDIRTGTMKRYKTFVKNSTPLEPKDNNISVIQSISKDGVIVNQLNKGASAGANAVIYGSDIAENASSVSSGVGQGLGVMAVFAVGTVVLNNLMETEGYQIVTEVEVNGQKTRVYAHAYDGSIEAGEVIPFLLDLTAQSIVEISKES